MQFINVHWRTFLRQPPPPSKPQLKQKAVGVMWLSSTPPHRLWATPVFLSRPQRVGGLPFQNLPWGQGLAFSPGSYRCFLSPVCGSYVLGNCLVCVSWHQSWGEDIPKCQGMDRIWHFVLRCWSPSPLGPHSYMVLEPDRSHLKARTPSPGCVNLGKSSVLSKLSLSFIKGSECPLNFGANV